MKQLPGSTSATRLREVTSRRLSVRLRFRTTSRTSQSPACASRTSSTAATAAGSPSVRSTQVPSSSSLKRRSRIASSSSRATARGHQRAPAAWMPAGSAGWGSRGPRTVSVATREPRSSSAVTWGQARRPPASSRSSGGSATPAAPSGRSDRAASSSARPRAAAARPLLGASSSTSRHSTARRPRTPSATVHRKSAWSRRTPRLSTIRVRPPVPGSTPRSGTSGRDTVLAPSSTSRRCSQARASS